MFIKQVTMETPLLLFDEVLSELDEARQRLLLDNLPDMQVLLTCTSLPSELAKQKDLALLDLRGLIAQEKVVSSSEQVTDAVSEVVKVSV